MSTSAQTREELVALDEGLDAWRDELRAALAAVEEDASAVHKTLLLLGVNGNGTKMRFPRLSLVGMTHNQAFVTLAKANGGRLLAKVARRALLDASLLKNPKTASSAVFTGLTRSKDFEKVGPGEYKLVADGELRFEPDDSKQE